MSVHERIGTLQERLTDRLGRAFGHCAVCNKPTRSHRVGSRVQCHSCHEADRFPVATDGGRDPDELRERVERFAAANPETDPIVALGRLGLGPEHLDLVEDILEDDGRGDDIEVSTSPAPRPASRWDVPTDEQCAIPGCHEQRRHPHDHSLCDDCHPGGGRTADQAAVDDAGPETQSRPAEEAGPAAAPDRDEEDADTDDAGVESIVDAMGPTDGLPSPSEQSTPSTPISASSPSGSAGGGGGNIGMPTGALPLGQLDALSPTDRRRAARKRGLRWPTTDEARDRLFDTIAEVVREADHRVIDAPTALGKTHTVAATRWAARDDITGDRPVVHLLETQDARDEAAAIADQEGGEHIVMLSRSEACPVAGGDFDPEAVADDPDREPITVEGVPASEWIKERCEGRGIHFSAVHRELEQRNDQSRELPCCTDGECRGLEQWADFREGNYSLVIATHNFAFAPGLRMENNVVLDEEPDYVQDLTTDRVRRAVTAYLREIDAAVDSWEQLVTVATGAGDLQDEARGHGLVESEYREGLVDDLRDDLEVEPDRDWYFSDPNAHTLAPALARAVLHAEERPNGRRHGKTPYEPPRLDGGAREDDGWNREWVSIVLDDAHEVQTVRAVPDFGAARSVVGLDAHPALPVWQANTVPWIERRRVLESDERRLWRRYERGLRVVQVGDATRPLASGEYFDSQGSRAIVEQLRETYGADFRTAVTAASVEDRLESMLERAGVAAPETMHYGEEKSRNDFASESVGLVEGSIDPGDDYVLNLLVELDLDAIPERSEGECERCEGEGCDTCAGTGHRRAHGRGFEGDDAETASAILASVREAHVAQAAGRYARKPEDPTSTATVFVRTDALPPGFADVQTPGVVWSYGEKQDRIVEMLREASDPKSARELADAADCRKEHVRQTLRRLEHDDRVDDVQALEGAGDHGATLYATDGVPTSGVVDLDAGIANSPVWDSYTWQLAVRDPDEAAASTDRAACGNSAPSPRAEADDSGPPPG